MAMSAPKGPIGKAKKGTILRVIKMLFKFYPVLAPLTVFCILFIEIFINHCLFAKSMQGFYPTRFAKTSPP
jgi:hypothetical protein